MRSTNKRTTASSYSNGITDSIGSSSRTGSSGSSSGSSAKLLRGEPGPQGPKVSVKLSQVATLELANIVPL